MPQRSNSFQRLVYKIHENLGPTWKVITESAMVPHRITGRDREVDIKAELVQPDRLIILAVECRDHARKADVTWVESILKKHEFLPTSELILWSRSGFTKDARQVAEYHGVACTTPLTKNDVNWGRLGRDLKDGYVKHVIPVFNLFVECKNENDEYVLIDCDEAHVDVFDKNGNIVSSSLTVFDFLKNHPTLRNTLLDHATSDMKNFVIEWRPAEEWFVLNQESRKVSISFFWIRIKTLVEVGKLATDAILYDGRLFTLTSTELPSGTLETMIEETAEGEPKISGSLLPKKLKKSPRKKKKDS